MLEISNKNHIFTRFLLIKAQKITYQEEIKILKNKKIKMKTHRNLPHRWMYWHMHIALNQKTLSKSLSHFTIMNDAIKHMQTTTYHNTGMQYESSIQDNPFPS